MNDIRFVVFHTPGANWLAGKSMFEQPGIMEHIGYFKEPLESGKLALGGPHPDDEGVG